MIPARLISQQQSNYFLPQEIGNVIIQIFYIFSKKSPFVRQYTVYSQYNNLNVLVCKELFNIFFQVFREFSEIHPRNPAPNPSLKALSNITFSLTYCRNTEKSCCVEIYTTAFCQLVSYDI